MSFNLEFSLPHLDLNLTLSLLGLNGSLPSLHLHFSHKPFLVHLFLHGKFSLSDFLLLLQLIDFPLHHILLVLQLYSQLRQLLRFLSHVHLRPYDSIAVILDPIKLKLDDSRVLLDSLVCVFDFDKLHVLLHAEGELVLHNFSRVQVMLVDAL